MRLYGTIEKAEPQADGTIIVTGYASSEDVDSQGEIVTAKAMADALPDYMKFANIREMHQPKAAGVALEAIVQDDGRTWLKAHIVDDDAVKKVQAQVYKGFSIGGKITGRDETNTSIITGVQLSEISLVDRPANGKAVFEMWKADSVAPVAEDASKVDGIDGDGPPEAKEKTDIAQTVQKGMYAVSTFAQLLQSIQYLQQDSQREAAIEGDNSPMPDELKVWLKAGAGLLAAMVVEEAKELTGDDSGGDDDPNLAMAAASTNLTKTGARNSKSDMEKIQSMHDSTVALGADCSGGMKHDHAADLRKADPLEEMEKRCTSEVIEICKVLGLPEGGDMPLATIKKMITANAGLQKRIEELEALPKPPKGAVKALSKEDDGIDTPQKQEEPPKDTFSAIKKIHSTGGRIISY